jgi:hypothetical protein
MLSWKHITLFGKIYSKNSLDRPSTNTFREVLEKGGRDAEI